MQTQASWYSTPVHKLLSSTQAELPAQAQSFLNHAARTVQLVLHMWDIPHVQHQLGFWVITLFACCAHLDVIFGQVAD